MSSLRMLLSTERRNVEDICASTDRLLPELGHDTPTVSDDFPGQRYG